MRLVYKRDRRDVMIGDFVTVGAVGYVVDYFRPPHKSSSEGHVTLRVDGAVGRREFYVSVIGAEWIDREDRVSYEVKPVKYLDGGVEVCDRDEADVFGLYKRLPADEHGHRLAEWLCDFNTEAAAMEAKARREEN